ncbi:MAG: hypothetical protein ABL872_15775 [Lacibacter sp.]
MKKAFLTAITILVSAAMLTAQISTKNKIIKTGTPVSLAGSWSGTLTNDYGLYPQAFTFQLTDRGEIVMASTNGTVAAKGTYTFLNNAFNASYKLFSSSETFAMAGTYDAGTQKLTCTQGTGTAVTGQGKLIVTRTGGQTTTMNNSNLNINTTIKPGVKTVGTAAPPPATTTPQSTGPNYGTTIYNSSTDLNEYYLKKATVTIYTGNDNKEAPSNVTVYLYTNTRSFYQMQGDTSTTNLIGSGGNKNTEYAVNSKTIMPMELAEVAWDMITYKPDYRPGEISLTTFNKNGLSLMIFYAPGFFTDAWKINRVELTVEFKRADGALHPQLGNKTITFTKSALMTEKNDRIRLVTDKFMFPLN